jgi:type I restriction enzyme S subunit
MSDLTPPGWRQVSLGNITAEQSDRVGTNRRATVLSCTKHHGLVPSETYFRNRVVFSQNLGNYKVVKLGWFAYATNHLSEGSIGLQERVGDFCVSPIYTVFSCSKDVSPEFLYRVLKSPDMLAKYALHEQSTVDRRGAIRYVDFAKIKILLPPVDEQSRIVQVVKVVDRAIHQVNLVIDKLVYLKEGVLEGLLSGEINGVSESETRNPVSQWRDFKASPIGPVPKCWDVAPLGTFISSIDYGISSALDRLGQIPVLRMNNLSDGEADLTDLKFAKRREVGGLFLSAGDVLFNRTNSIKHVGKSCIWRGQVREASFASYLLRLNNDHARLNSEFLTHWLNCPHTQQRVRKYATPGVQQVNINPSNLRRVLIALPRLLAEQESIVEVVNALHRRIDSARSRASKLSLIKEGLTADLLAGRVCTPVAKREIRSALL